jgi:Arc/MetJ-type ribon-helix-helix transcriptional regulator
MKRKRKGRVSEAAPVQVYLAGHDRERLERLAERLELTKSDVVRQGIQALERQMTNPAYHPLLSIIGIAGDAGRDDRELGYSVGVEHDRFLAEVAEAEMAEWRKERARKRRRAR